MAHVRTVQSEKTRRKKGLKRGISPRLNKNRVYRGRVAAFEGRIVSTRKVELTITWKIGRFPCKSARSSSSISNPWNFYLDPSDKNIFSYRGYSIICLFFIRVLFAIRENGKRFLFARYNRDGDVKLSEDYIIFQFRYLKKRADKKVN